MSFLSNLFPFKKIDKYYVVVLLATCIYAVVWSKISLDRFYSLNAYVYDAGLFMQDWHDVITVHWTLSSFFLSFTFRGLKFIFFPIIIPRSFALLFIFQTIFIAISAPLIYLVAVKNGLKKDIGCVLAISYLIFFPLAGTNFFDLHNIAFFPTLFLFGYYFASNGNMKLSIIFFILASLVKYPLSLLVIVARLKKTKIKGNDLNDSIGRNKNGPISMRNVTIKSKFES